MEIVPFWQAVMIVNVILLVFNLVPAFPMDGGRVLRAVLSRAMPKPRATAIAAKVGQGFAILFMLFGLPLFGAFNPLLFLIGLFVFLAAGQEAAATQSVSLLGGHKARDAMMTRFETLGHGDTLGRAAQLLLETNQHDFPVFGGGEVIGLLERRALVDGLNTHGRDHFVAEVMARAFPVVAPGDDLQRAYEAIRAGQGTPVLVIDAGELVGLLDQENLMEFVMLAQTRQPGS